MNHEPLISVPYELADETVAQLLDLLYDIAAALESQYAGQLHRYYQQRNDDDPEHTPTVLPDPPF